MGFLPTVAIGATVLGGLVKANAQDEQANVQAQAIQADAAMKAAQARVNQQAMLAQAQAASYNATIANQSAVLSTQQSREQEARYRTAAKGEIAQQSAAFSASGVELSGSATDVLAASMTNAELNALTIRHEGVVRTQAFQNAEQLDLFQAKVATSQASFIGQTAGYIESQGAVGAQAARQAGGSAAAATLLNTATSVYGMQSIGGTQIPGTQYERQGVNGGMY
jgi:hypothetical protein